MGTFLRVLARIVTLIFAAALITVFAVAAFVGLPLLGERLVGRYTLPPQRPSSER